MSRQTYFLEPVNKEEYETTSKKFAVGKRSGYLFHSAVRPETRWKILSTASLMSKKETDGGDRRAEEFIASAAEQAGLSPSLQKVKIWRQSKFVFSNTPGFICERNRFWRNRREYLVWLYLLAMFTGGADFWFRWNSRLQPTVAGGWVKGIICRLWCNYNLRWWVSDKYEPTFWSSRCKSCLRWIWCTNHPINKWVGYRNRWK